VKEAIEEGMKHELSLPSSQPRTKVHGKPFPSTALATLTMT
jgi:hypothetical protein